MAETKIVYVDQRRICWPNPDATCLEGGCGYCNDSPWRNIGTIRNYARKAGIVPNRGIGEKDALVAFQYGYDWGWPNTDKRTVPKRVPA